MASIASNITSFLPTREDILRDGILTSASKNIPLTVAVAIIFTLLLNTLLTPRLDPREPPLLKPSIPFIGHIIDMFRYQAKFHIIVSRKSNDKYPVASLQMLNGKMYAIWDPEFIASGFKNKILSVDPIIDGYIDNLMAPSREGLKVLISPEGHDMTHEMIKHLIPTALRGVNLEKMTRTALGQLALTFTELAASPTGEQIPNFYLWARHLLCFATSTALYGKPEHDPFRLNPNMEQAIFDFEASLLQLSLGLPFPSITAAKGFKARQILVKGLEPYYGKKFYEFPEASEFVRARAQKLQSDPGCKLPVSDIPKVEIMVPFAAMGNSAPTLFWLLVFVLASPQERRDRLRKEIQNVMVLDSPDSGNSSEVRMKVSHLLIENECPLLKACFRETLRVSVHQITSRVVTEDTVIQNSSGQEYLLKKGTQVQMSAGNVHKSPGWWGEDADEFKPERWLDPQNIKTAKTAWVPFGGGIHLCPGRNFAMAELAAIVAIFVLGFEVEPNAKGKKEWKLPEYRLGSLVDAVSKPAEEGRGFGVNVKARKGWENVKWNIEYAS
ncbi:cytochrome P450 [Podospora fimiseda]|uniref:Cytochrome P450 n=1 Tax=Podospora fimiseda TaxID=252190 RepID=A0AAN7BCT6_9PEZI|nr:cytochrome P450 [Podospora fimiseda]